MNTSEMYDLVVIGGGPGGLTAGIYAMRAALKTLLIEKGATGGQVNNSNEVENWPGEEKISGMELAAKMTRHAESYGLSMVNREVIDIDPGIDWHEVRLSEGEPVKTLAVILATGGSPKKLGVPGEDEFYGKGVSYCAVCDGFFYRNKTVVVVGGGDSAAEEALYLAKIATKVYMVHRRDALRAGKILQKRVLNESRIEMIWDTVVSAIGADEGGVSEVRLQNVHTGEEKTLNTDGVFIFIGFEPNNSLVPAGTKMNGDGYVVTDEKCATTLPGIYAIGDLREKYARQIVTAAADGCTAALAAARYVEEKKGHES